MNDQLCHPFQCAIYFGRKLDYFLDKVNLSVKHLAWFSLVIFKTETKLLKYRMSLFRPISLYHQPQRCNNHACSETVVINIKTYLYSQLISLKQFNSIQARLRPRHPARHGIVPFDSVRKCVKISRNYMPLLLNLR